MSGSPKISKTEAEAASRDAAARFREAAAAEGLVDVAIATMPSPVGELLVAVTGRGVAAIAFDDDYRDELLERIAAELSPRIVATARQTDATRHELEEYFSGTRERFDLRLDRRLMHPFAKQVLAATAKRSVRPGDHVRADRDDDRPSDGGAGGGRGARLEPDPDRSAVSSRDRRRREADRLRRRAAPQGVPPGAGGRDRAAAQLRPVDVDVLNVTSVTAKTVIA